MKKLLVGLLLLPLVCLGDVSIPPAASQAEVNAGVLTSKYVSPATLAGYSGGGGSATNTISATGDVSAPASSSSLNTTFTAAGLTKITNVVVGDTVAANQFLAAPGSSAGGSFDGSALTNISGVITSVIPTNSGVSGYSGGVLTLNTNIPITGAYFTNTTTVGLDVNRALYIGTNNFGGSATWIPFNVDQSSITLSPGTVNYMGLFSGNLTSATSQRVPNLDSTIGTIVLSNLCYGTYNASIGVNSNLVYSIYHNGTLVTTLPTLTIYAARTAPPVWTNYTSAVTITNCNIGDTYEMNVSNANTGAITFNALWSGVRASH